MDKDLELRTFIKNNGIFRRALLLWAKNQYDCYNVPIILKNSIKKELIKIYRYNELFIAEGLNNTMLELFKNLVNEYTEETNNKSPNKNLLMYIKTHNSIRNKLYKNTISDYHPNRLDDYPLCKNSKQLTKNCLPNCKWCLEYYSMLNDFKKWKNKKYINVGTQTDFNL